MRAHHILLAATFVVWGVLIAVVAYSVITVASHGW